MLRLWRRREGLRSIERLFAAERKAIRRYVLAAEALGLDRDGGEEQLTDELIGAVLEAVRPARPHGQGVAWQRCEAERDRMKGWLDADVPVVKIAELLARRGVVAPERTLHRFCAEVLGRRRSRLTVLVVDREPGEEVQVDFGRLGYLIDTDDRRRLLRALLFTAVVSRHMFVWRCHRETLADVIDGCQTHISCEAAWTFFGGVFRVLVTDNLAALARP